MARSYKRSNNIISQEQHKGDKSIISFSFFMSSLDNFSEEPSDSERFLHMVFRRLDELHIDKELRQEGDLHSMRMELDAAKNSFDSPENIGALRNEMHHWRRDAEEIRAKLSEAEAFIQRQEADIKDKERTMEELRKRCHELETNSSNNNNVLLTSQQQQETADNTYNVE